MGAIEGLVWAFAFDPDGRAETLPDAAVPERIETHDGWLWLHFNLTDSRAREWLGTSAPIGQASRDILLSPDNRQRLMAEAGEVAGVLSDYHLEFDGDATLEIGRLRFAVTDRMIVSARHHPLQAVEGVRRDIANGKRIPDTTLFLEAVVDGFLDAATEGLVKDGERLDEVEERTIAGRRPQATGIVGSIRRTTLRLHREVVPLRAALRRAATPSTGAEGFRLHGALAASARRLVLRLDALDHEIHSLQERARLVRDEIDALAAADTNRHLYTLTALSALLLPGTLITGIFGMNTKDLPLQQTDSGFWYAIGLIACATALVVVFLRSRRPAG